MFCEKCGTELMDNAVFCLKCGNKIGENASEQNKEKNMADNVDKAKISDKSRLVALLLCIFLGGFGAHRFYAGRTKSGILRLCLGVISLFLLSIPWLGVLGWLFLLTINIIDIVLIAIGELKDKYGNVIKDWKIEDFQ